MNNVVVSVSAILIFAGSSFVFFFLFLQQLNKNKSISMQLNNEYSRMTEALTRVSFGQLNQEMRTGTLNDSIAQVAGNLDIVKNAFNKITSEPLERLCFIGTDAWQEGCACARRIGERLKNGGSVAVIVTSSLEALIMAQRHRAFTNTLQKEFPKVRLLATFEARANQENAKKFVLENIDILDAIYLTGNSAVPGVSIAIQESGKAGQIHILCHDLDKTIVRSIKENLVSESMICSTYAQGRDAVLHVFNHLSTGWKPKQSRLMLALHIADRHNLSEFWDERAEEPLRNSYINETGIKSPVRASRNLRILVFCEDWNNAFLQMKAGVEMARAQLAGMNAEIIVHVLNQLKRPVPEVTAEALSIIQKEKQRGLDGIASFVGMAEMVPLLNHAASEGIIISSFNSEPLALRSMIRWLLQGAEQLDRFAGEYQSGHSEIKQALSDILIAINDMVGRIQTETESVQNGAQALSNLEDLIDRTVDEEKAQTTSIRESQNATTRLMEMASFFEERVSGLKDMGRQVKLSAEKTVAMQDFSGKIESIIGIIDSIADQTNLLAFNAAVEASHAGERGKGFKVISQEIRALADKSGESTRNIRSLIHSMQATITEGINANTKSTEIVEEQVNSISNASSNLAELSTNLQSIMINLNQAIERNIEAISKMRESVKSLSGVIQESAHISSENSSTMATISSTFTEIDAQFSEMNKQTGNLAELVTVLEGTVSTFSAD